MPDGNPPPPDGVDAGGQTALAPLSASRLGFSDDAGGGWQRPDRGTRVRYRSLCRLADLVPLEQLQIDVFGVAERDVIPASELVVVPETGGAVLAAYVEADPARTLAGALFGWGGYVEPTPLVVSDFLAVRPEHRGLGIAFDLKLLQAVLAAARGFRRITWTVDPLRAGNAHLNANKLAATARRYERNRYGESFGSGLYGGMPTDRIQMEWDLASPRVHHRLSHPDTRRPTLADVPPYEPGLRAPRAFVEIPTDVDALLAADPAAALRWRLQVRAALESAFAEGWQVTGLAADGQRAAHLLTPVEHEP